MGVTLGRRGRSSNVFTNDQRRRSRDVCVSSVTHHDVRYAVEEGGHRQAEDHLLRCGKEREA